MSAPLLLDDDCMAFMEGFALISVGSRNRDLLPSLSRASGCRVFRAEGAVRLFLPRPQCATLLDDLAATGAIAVVFTAPDSYRALQLKGQDARVGALESGDWETVERYRNLFSSRMAGLGYPETAIRTMFACPEPEMRAATFTPHQAFNQTPGPSAGMPLGGQP